MCCISFLVIYLRDIIIKNHYDTEYSIVDIRIFKIEFKNKISVVGNIKTDVNNDNECNLI